MRPDPPSKRNSVNLYLVLFLAWFTVGRMSASSIVTEGVVDAPVSEVWSAWTTSEGLRSWLAPHVDIDLRIGGRMRTNYSATGALGDAGTIENRILAFEPERMLAIQVSKSPDGFPFRDSISSMWTVLYFSPVADGKTHLRIVGLGFTDDEQSQKMKAYFTRGNQFTLEQLQKRFAAPKPPE
jgi:uncharacterized protein YndB with AHSA1/START domain